MVRGPLFWTGWKPLHKALKEQRTKWDLVDVEKEPGRGASCRMKRPVAVGVCGGEGGAVGRAGSLRFGASPGQRLAVQTDQLEWLERGHLAAVLVTPSSGSACRV